MAIKRITSIVIPLFEMRNPISQMILFDLYFSSVSSGQWEGTEEKQFKYCCWQHIYLWFCLFVSHAAPFLTSRYDAQGKHIRSLGFHLINYSQTSTGLISISCLPELPLPTYPAFSFKTQGRGDIKTKDRWSIVGLYNLC